MSRDNHNQGAGEMGNNRKQNQMIRDAAREVGVDPDKLSEKVHSSKNDWDSGDYKYWELVEMARELKVKGY